VKVYISIDAEGVAGITDWEQIRTKGDDYALGRRLMLGELNAAIAGILAVDAGATIVVNDAHGAMRNFPPDEIDGEAQYISGRHKPLYMMQGLDATFDAIVFIGYHGSIGARDALLSHTYNPRAIWEVRIDGQVVGESALNGLVAAHYGVPIACITGDEATAAEARAFIPAIETVVVKQSYSRFSASNLHPNVARRRIQSGVQHALESLTSRDLVPRYATPTQIAVTFVTADMAATCTVLRHVTLSADDPRTVICANTDPDEDYLELYQAFVGMTMITYSLVD